MNDTHEINIKYQDDMAKATPHTRNIFLHVIISLF